MKSRTGQHQTVNQSHREADLNSLPQRAQHATRLRAMNEQFVANARVTGGNHEWLAVNREANMADKTFVKNLIDQLSVLPAALSQTFQIRSPTLRPFIHSLPSLLSS